MAVYHVAVAFVACMSTWCIVIGDTGGALPPLTAAERELDRTSLTYVWHLIRMAGRSYTNVFCSRSTDDCATVENFPGNNVHSELRFEEVVDGLSKTPGREIRGEIRRLGDLGYFIFNDLLWAKDWKVFPIGADLDLHRKNRPIADVLMGFASPAWNQSMVRDSVKAFLSNRTTLNKDTVSVWVTKFFHKTMLDLELTDEEVDAFHAYKGKSFIFALLPRWLVSSFGWLFGLEKARTERDFWLEKYEQAIEKDSRNFYLRPHGQDRRFLADLLLTVFTSAGGLSVPTMIHICLGIIYGGDNSPLPVEQRNLSNINIEALVLESIRRYPPVVGFPWWSPDQSKRTVMNVAMALRDPRAWGDDALEFKLRPLTEYHQSAGSGSKIGVAWAEQAKGPDGLTPDSRGCPGQALSVVMITEFLRALRPTQFEWVVKEMPKGGIQITEGPSQASDFTISREESCDANSEGQCLNDKMDAAAQADEDVFFCPRECLYCCQNFLMATRLKTEFRCLLSADDMLKFNSSPRKCSKPVLESDKSKLIKRAVSKCKLFKHEVSKDFAHDLPICPDTKNIYSYKEFLGEGRLAHLKKDFCSISYTGTVLGIGIVEEVIRHRFFNVQDMFGGVCENKAKEFIKAGLFKGDLRRETENLCTMLKGDLHIGILDKFTLAMWAAGYGALAEQNMFPKPQSVKRELDSFRIPGWSAKNVAFTALPEDRPVGLEGGAFMCMMRMLQELPLDDDLVDYRNNYAPWPVGRHKDVQAIFHNYFDRFGLYQKPLHFPLQADALQTDRALEMLVFEAIGGHRVEVVYNGRSQSLSPIQIDGYSTSASLRAALSALPSDFSKRIAFAVRLEGLFDDLPLRKDMARWGGNAFFDSTGRLAAIQYRGETLVAGEHKSSAKWHMFKFAFRSSLISTVTAFDHLVPTHILAAQTLAVSVAETLPPWHGLRILLTPHVWGTIRINLGAANNLFAKNMLVHRASPYGEHAFEGPGGSDGLLWQKIKALRYKTFMQNYEGYTEINTLMRQGGTDPPEIPFFEDGVLLFKALRGYVSEFIHTLYGGTQTDAEKCNSKLIEDRVAQRFVTRFYSLTDPSTPYFWPESFRYAAMDCEKLIAFLAEIIFLVTGWHRHVGSVADFFRDTSFAATAWKDGEQQARPKHSIMMMLLAATTNAKFPKLNQGLASVYNASSESSKTDFLPLFENLHASMQQVQAEISARNQKRQNSGHLEFNQMDPQHIEWGVEV